MQGAIPTREMVVANVEVHRSPISTTPIQMDVDGVIVPVTVRGPYDRGVTGLGADNVGTFDDRARQKIYRSIWMMRPSSLE